MCDIRLINMDTAHNNSIDPHQEEVRKLQNLVRELEVQNLQLRNQQLSSNYLSDKNAERTLESVRKMKNTGNDYRIVDSDIGTFDEVELIDVARLNLTDEDSWLYELPELSTKEQNSISPYQWMRSDVDDPRQIAIQAVKRGLVRQIEALSSTPSLSRVVSRNSYSIDEDSIVPKNSFSSKLYEKFNKELVPSVEKHKNFDSRTFTRPKKTVVSVELPVVDTVRVVDGEGISTTPKLATISSTTSDVIDIQTLARLQEECLRQSSSPSTPRRNSGTASRTSSNSTSPSMSPFGSQNLDDPISGRIKVKNLRQNGLTSHLNSFNQQRYGNQPGCDMTNCDKIQTGRIPRYSVSPSPKGGNNSRSGSPAASRLSAPGSIRCSPPPPLEDGQHESRIAMSRIPKPRTRLPVYTRDSWKDGCY